MKYYSFQLFMSGVILGLVLSFGITSYFFQEQEKEFKKKLCDNGLAKFYVDDYGQVTFRLGYIKDENIFIDNEPK